MNIAITGLGAVTCLGNSVDELWQNICQGNTGILPYEFNSSVIKTKKIGKVKNFTLDPIFDSRWRIKTDVHIQYALNAAKEAVDQSKLNFDNIDPGRIHTVIGTTAGSYDFVINNQQRINSGKAALPNFIPGHINNMMSAYINMHWNIQGSGLGISGACAAGSQAISIAAMLIETGQADVVICGASDSWLSELTISGFESLGALGFGDIMPRPFDQSRDGFAISEGSAILILENTKHAQNRGAEILGFLSGYGISNDAYHPTSPDPEGTAFLRMTNQALSKAKISTDQVDYINAHATATKIGDVVECQNLYKLFKDRPFISSTKSMTGHSIGSTSAIEAVISVLSLKNNIIPGTINLNDVDPQCPGNHLKETINHTVKNVVSTSFGFGGTNGILIFSDT
jgi:3-oxoacyl-[acyl-carrier-protein] synthase II